MRRMSSEEKSIDQCCQLRDLHPDYPFVRIGSEERSERDRFNEDQSINTRSIVEGGRLDSTPFPSKISDPNPDSILNQKEMIFSNQ